MPNCLYLCCWAASSNGETGIGPSYWVDIAELSEHSAAGLPSDAAKAKGALSQCIWAASTVNGYSDNRT